ncbi:LOW QUALITY PROTEIN: nucleolar complex protein 4 homolog [Falco naumanni]|uniref:LOW QUALITY PROTEIN: nucleolar complex protein 4 homolog n=1 Tax=Falco naumanni TaxID=148594 RepID=UPI001ADE9B4F|nr:LOW QUALITY PROTEIN: nucleolar complex protein 4 homolog [Falco naumanni]
MARAAAVAACVQAVLGSRASANRVFELLELLGGEDEEDAACAARACGRLFGALLQRGELLAGPLPAEEACLAGSGSAEDKYKAWMRHRYHECVAGLAELMGHGAFRLKELALCTLMRFVELEAKHPLVAAERQGSRTFPRERLKVVVDGLLPINEDASLLISRFQEYMEYDDIRYFVIKAVTGSIAQVMQKTKERPLPFYQQNVFSLISPINMPNKESDMVKFLVKQDNWEELKVSKLQAHKQAFEKMWLSFLKHKLPAGLYKKVLVIMHDSILPYMNEPTLMIDFLTVAYGIGGAISLLALNGLFILIHQHNLEYPDFYKKLYSLLDPSIYHVKYRARFFHLTDLFLSSSHLPAYLVAAFIKRLSRLALTAPPEALLMIIPFICNLFRRHPVCSVLVHRPNGPAGMSEDPYIMEEEQPSQSRALESSLWEIQTLQNHYHPDVAKAAAILNHSLSEIEDDLSGLLELSAYELFDKEVKKKAIDVPLEFEQVRGLFGKKNDIFAEHFTLD